MRLTVPIILAAVLGSVMPAHAELRVALFEDGRTLEVDSAERDGELALLRLEDGGEIALPASRIVNWEELDRPIGKPPAAKPAAHEALSDASWRNAAGDFADLIKSAAERHELDPVLLVAMAQVESNFDPRAVSHKGASGLLQLMPATARRFGVRDVFDPGQNVEAGARYLKWLLERFEGSTELALAGYNAGEGTVDRYQGVPPYPETRQYVNRVLQGASRLSRLEP